MGELGLNLLFETRETIPLRRALRTQPQVAQLLLKATPTHTPPCVFCFNPLHCWVEVVNPDASGFGELCITVLNTQAVIALPRYATGDWGRMVSHDEACQAAQLAQVPCPWLPLVVLKGRIKDRPLGQPSVEDIKTLIYTDFQVADQLTGAFRLTHAGGLHLTVQAASEQAAPDPDLHARLSQLIERLLTVPVQLEILAPGAFVSRPQLDFERKFSYLG